MSHRSGRPNAASYRPGLGLDAALKEIEEKRGTSVDAQAVDACLRLFREKHFVLKNL
jgi:HD-GYP domain-containing protein (c-di-GMP phosphodiesterase class II)